MLDALFKPKAVAVIGASSKELSIGNAVIANLQAYGYTGAVYPINPTAAEIRGLKAYQSVHAVPGAIDLAHIVLPAHLVPEAVAACGEKGVKAVIINSAGFQESGDEGARLQEQFLAHARKHGVRVVGPNCQGIINSDPAYRAYCNFTNTFPLPGGISVAALSGGVGGLIMQGLADLGIGLRMYASNGNACDVSLPEIVRYWGEDAGTKAIVVYTEGFADPGAFLRAAEVAATRKPLLAMKAGRTEQGAKAATSHTGMLAGAGIATDLIFEKAGILSFRDEGEMIRAAMAFASQPVPAGNRVGIITNTGGPAVIATDVLVDAGLDVPMLSARSMARLKAELLPQAAVENPVDVVATASAGHFRTTLETLIEDEEIDSIFINFVTPAFSDTQAIAREIVAASRRQVKPVVCNFMTDLTQERFQVTQCILMDGGVPCYGYPSDAAKALGALARYGRIRRRTVGTPQIHAGVDAARAREVIEQARQSGRGILSAREVYTVFEAYGLPVAPWRVVESADDAVAAAQDIGFPVVVKVDTQDIDHKSDLGGVAVNLADATAVRAAVQAMEQRLGAFGRLRFLVQKFLPGGRELIVGATIQPSLGHMIMVGLGGIYVEVLHDVAFRLAPVTQVEAEEMLASIKAAALLDGVRGQAGVDKRSIVEVIQRLSQMLADLPMIQELDINPLLAFADSAAVVDGRIRI